MKNAHQVHRGRRDALIAAMRRHSGGGLALMPTSAEVVRNRDSTYPYRHDSYFYYLTGFPEPEAVVALVADDKGDRHVLFCREKHPERETWDGFRYGPDAAKDIFGFDEAHPIGELDRMLPDFASDRPALYTPIGMHADWDRRVAATLNEVRSRVRTGVSAPDEIVDLRGTLDRMRLVKDAHELTLMRRAGAISSEAHRRAMARARPGWHEYEVEAELAHEFLKSGAQSVAYPSIVASGPNACVLHYRDNDRLMADGIRFTQFLAGSSVCAPTRCTLLTGKHSGRSSLRTNGGWEAIRAGEADYHFVEVMACPGGCLGGGGQPIPTSADIRMARAGAIYQADGDMPIRRSHENPSITAIYEKFLGEPLSHKSHHLLHTEYKPRTTAAVQTDN